MMRHAATTDELARKGLTPVAWPHDGGMLAESLSTIVEAFMLDLQLKQREGRLRLRRGLCARTASTRAALNHFAEPSGASVRRQPCACDSYASGEGHRTWMAETGSRSAVVNPPMPHR
jgi:hypothetical protein